MIEYNKKNARMWSIMGISPSIWSIGFQEVINGREDVALLTADLARFSGLQRVFANRPEMCYNIGIAEQNMTGAAAGMAMEGIQTWMTTYAPFVTLRCADHIRHLMGNLHLNMKAIGSAAGLSGGWSGNSLLAISDIAFMRSVPNMVVLTPADCMEAVKMIEAMAKTNEPCYMRFGGSVNLPMVYTDDYDFEIGKAITLKKGTKVALVAAGTNIVSEALKASSLIEKEKGFIPTVVNMHTIKPVDKDCLDSLAKNHDIIISIEDHNVIGGLGSAISEYIVTKNYDVRQVFMGVQDRTYSLGNRAYMLEQAGLTAQGITDCVMNEINK